MYKDSGVHSSQDFRTERFIDADEILFSEIISALSVSLDITQGLPQGHCMRTALIGMRLADELQLSVGQRHALFYALLLKDLGCSNNAAKISHLFGTDDHEFKRSIRFIDWSNPAACIRHCWTHGPATRRPLQKLKFIVSLLTTKAKEVRRISDLRCDRGAAIARKLCLPDSTADAIYHLDELWNGRGNPAQLKGDEIPLLARICGLAQAVEVFLNALGLDSAMEMARARRGKWFDPELVDLLLSLKDDKEFWKPLSGRELARELSHYEPQEVRLSVDEDCLDRIAESFAMVVDAKSPWTHRHSLRVGDIAAEVGKKLGCSGSVQRDIRRAGLLHDIGKLGVSNCVLDKPGKPTPEEFAQIKRHPEFTCQILRQVEAFGKLAEITGAHHERLDGQGYHLGLDGSQIPVQTRILTVADIFEAMTARRPYREALSWDQAIELMNKQVGTAIDAECMQALVRWADTAQLESRLDDQLNAVDELFCQL